MEGCPSKVIASALSLIVLGCILTVCNAAAQDTTTSYLFVGSPFNNCAVSPNGQVNHINCPKGSHLTGGFTLAQPLPANYVSPNGIGGPGDFTPESFCFSDGTTTISGSNSGRFSADTDANGNLSQWSIRVDDAVGDEAGAFFGPKNAGTNSSSGMQALNYGYFFNSSLSRNPSTPGGVWTIAKGKVQQCGPTSNPIKIVLTPNPALPSLVFPGGVFKESIVTATANVTDENGPVSGFALTFAAKALDQQRSGHNHTDPLNSDIGFFLDSSGSLTRTGSCSTMSGSCSVSYSVSEVSGIYSIIALPSDPSSTTSPASATLTVQVTGLQKLPLVSGPIPYLLTGNGGTTNIDACPGNAITHPANHYGTQYLDKGVEGFATEYLVDTGYALKINDMSLNWGGLLDICSNWFSPHNLHRDGKSVDVERTTLSGSGQSVATDTRRLDFLAGTWGLRRICEGKRQGNSCIGGPLHYQSAL
jgi:hypothetical protein